MSLYNAVLLTLAIVLVTLILSFRHVKADSTTVTTTPQATITTTITPDRTITTIVSPPWPSAPLTQAPPVYSPPQTFMPEAAPTPAPVPSPSPKPKQLPRYPTVPQRQCPCPDPTYYEEHERYYQEHYPPVAADRVMRGTANCNGVGC